MSKNFTLFICIFFSTIAFSQSDEVSLDTQNSKRVSSVLLKKIDEVRAPKVSFSMNIEVIVYKGDKKSHFSLIVGAKNENSFAIYKSPKINRGQTILSLDKNIWLYIPRSTHVFRISPHQKILGQASAIDILSIQFYKNYSITSYKESEDLSHIKLKSINNLITYDLIDLVVERKSLITKKLSYFSKSGKHLKTVEVLNVKKLAGQNRPSKFVIKDALNKKLKSVISFHSIYLRKIPDKHFTKSHIKKIARYYLSKNF